MSLLQDSTTFFHVSQSSVGVAQAQKTGHLDTTLLLPLPRCRQRFAFLPTSRQLFSVPALHPGNRHRGDSSPCGQSPMDFESISLAARTQCLLPARTHHATWHTDSFLLVSHLSSHCGSHWFTVLSHLQLVSSSWWSSSVCKCGHIYREHKGNK